jgi:hypothetical protein
MAEIRVETGTGTITRTPLLRRTAWGAIFAGTFVALACQVLLTALGVAIGAATINPSTESGNAASGVGIFAGIWWLITGLISLFCGGLVTAWLAGFPRWVDGMIHGVVVWGLTLALSMYLLTTSAASLVGGAMGTLQSAMMSPATQQVYQDVASNSGSGGGLEQTVDQWTHQAKDTLTQNDTSSSPLGVDEKTQAILDQHLGSSTQITETQRQAAIQALVDDKDMDKAKAQALVAEYEQLKQGTPPDQIKPQDQGSRQASNPGQNRILAAPEQHRVERAAQGAANFVANAAVWSFFALLLGLCAAAIGGAIGRPQYLLEDHGRTTLVA